MAYFIRVFRFREATRQRINDQYIVWLNTRDFKDEASKDFSTLAEENRGQNTYHVPPNIHLLLPLRPPSRSRLSRRRPNHVRRKRRRLLHIGRRNATSPPRPRDQYLQSLCVPCHLTHHQENSRLTSFHTASVLPLLAAKQRVTHKNDWMTTDALIACPDPCCPSQLRIVREGIRTFEHGETTLVPLGGEDGSRTASEDA
jgi:hypothetical protein